jgi:hypothetical protein
METTENTQTQIVLQSANQQAADADRRAHEVAMDVRRTRADMIRLAKDILTENARNKPAEEAEITAAQITTLADELNTYVSG